MKNVRKSYESILEDLRKSSENLKKSLRKASVKKILWKYHGKLMKVLRKS